MSEMLILDVGLPDADYQEIRGLFSRAETLRLAGKSIVKCHEVDRAVFVANFRDAGPFPYQYELIQENREVGTWIVYAKDADAAILQQYRVLLNGMASVYSDLGEIRKLLSQKPARRNSCLILEIGRTAALEGLVRLLKVLAPAKTFSTVHIDAPDAVNSALEASPAAQVIVVGSDVTDFSGVEFPESVHPFIVLTGRETNAFSDNAISDVCNFLPTVPKDSIYYVGVQYEQWRIDVEAKTRQPGSLVAETNFVMWDDFGLPGDPEAYHDYEAIRSFLNTFGDCSVLAKEICKKT